MNDAVKKWLHREGVSAANIARGLLTFAVVWLLMNLGRRFLTRDQYDPILTVALCIALACGRQGLIGALVHRQWTYRFSTSDLLIVTAFVAVIVSVVRQMVEIEGSLSYRMLILLVGASFASGAKRLVSNSRWFIESWYQLEGKPRVILPVRFVWLPQLLILLVLLVGIGVVNAAVPSQWAPFCSWFLLGVAVTLHGAVNDATLIAEYDNGVYLCGKLWRWEEGRLALIERDGVTRLAPSRVQQEPAGRLTRWPVVPPDKIDEVRALLAEKQGPEGATDNTVDTDA